jgi:hypothetical protein
VRYGQHYLRGIQAGQRLVEGTLAVQLEEEVASVDEVEDEVQLLGGLRYKGHGCGAVAGTAEGTVLSRVLTQ